MTAQARLQQLRRDLKPLPLPEQIERVRERRLRPSIGIGRKQLAKMRAVIAGMELEDLRELVAGLESSAEGEIEQ